jgi:hypothetical protein
MVINYVVPGLLALAEKTLPVGPAALQPSMLPQIFGSAKYDESQTTCNNFRT